MNGLEVLRSAVDEMFGGAPCDVIMRVRGKESCDDDESCSECMAEALRRIACMIEGEMRAMAEWAGTVPEGLEWPRFEDGEPVGFGDAYTDKHGREWDEGIKGVSVYSDGRFELMNHLIGESGMFVQFDAGDPVKRPAPKVYDADGVPIKKGDTVYVAPFDDPLTVRGFAADGRVLMDYHSDDSFGYSPENLTHAKPEPPDTWQRIEDDATLSPREYYAMYVGHDVGLKDDEEVNGAFGNSLVRRCKALAERERGE